MQDKELIINILKFIKILKYIYWIINKHTISILLRLKIKLILYFTYSWIWINLLLLWVSIYYTLFFISLINNVLDTSTVLILLLSKFFNSAYFK